MVDAILFSQVLLSQKLIHRAFQNDSILLRLINVDNGYIHDGYAKGQFDDEQ